MIKIGFFGTPKLAADVLKDLQNDPRFQVSFCVTNPDKPVWRSSKLAASPVKLFALENSIPYFQPEKIRWNEDFLSRIKSYAVDYFVVVAYWKILPKDILEIPKKKCINIHWSILPKYRWASPIQSSLISWDEETWVTIMEMWEEMDTWAIIDIKKIKIDKFDTVETLFEKFSEVSWNFLAETLLKLDNNEISPTEQNHEEATYCKKISKLDWEIDFNLSAKEIFNRWKWLTPWPWIYWEYKWLKLEISSCDFKVDISDIGVDLKIWTIIQSNWEVIAICWHKTWLILKELKLEWKPKVTVKDFINWHKDLVWSSIQKAR